MASTRRISGSSGPGGTGAGVVRTEMLSKAFDVLTEFIRELDALTIAPDAANETYP